MQTEFRREAEKYLKENYKGQYVIFISTSISIITTELYKERGFKFGIEC